MRRTKSIHVLTLAAAALLFAACGRDPATGDDAVAVPPSAPVASTSIISEGDAIDQEEAPAGEDSPTSTTGTGDTTSPATVPSHVGSASEPPVTTMLTPDISPTDTSGTSGITGDEDVDQDGDLERAEAALLTLADFPAGWTAVADEESADNDVFDAAALACFGHDDMDGIFGDEARAATDDFVDPSGTVTVSETINVAPSEEVAIFRVGAMADVDVDCLHAVYTAHLTEMASDASVEAGATVEFVDVRVGTLDVPPIGDQVAGLRVVASVEVDGVIAGSMILDAIGIRVDRTLIGMGFVSEDEPAPPSIIQGATLAAIDNLEEHNSGGVAG